LQAFTKIEASVIDLLTHGGSEYEICAELGLDQEGYHAVWRGISDKIDSEQMKSLGDFSHALLFERARCAVLMARLRAADHLLRGLMTISPEGILIIQGRTGRILDANKQCETLFGYKIEELVGMVVESLLLPDQEDLHIKLRQGFLRSIRKREIGYHPPIHAKRKDGTMVELVVGLTSSTASEEVMVVCSLASESGIKVATPIREARGR
jgi:PAS domain S-box-containing protein